MSFFYNYTSSKFRTLVNNKNRQHCLPSLVVKQGNIILFPGQSTKAPYKQCNINTLRPRQNGRRFADDMFKCIFLNENVWIPIEISLTFVPKGSISNNPVFIQIMAWRRPGDKPLSEPMMVSSLTHICVTRPQWVEENQHLKSKLVQNNMINTHDI